MDWKKEAISKLRGYPGAKAALQNIPEELARMRSQMEGIRSATADGTPTKGGGNGREDAILTNLVYQEELKRRLRQNKYWVSQVERALDTLNPEQRLVLDRLYMRNTRNNIDRLCEELGLEKSAVYDRRESALRRFTRALYGFESC